MNSVTMMFFIFVISLLHLGSTTVQRRAYAGCPNGWTVYEQSCYITGHTAVDFHSAVTFCHHYHGKLVEIETDAENDFLRNFLVDFKDPNHWIGLTDSIIEGEWRWYSNDLVASYVDWYPGEPNNEKLHNCALTYGSGQYNHHWVDAPCNGKYFPLCELPVKTPVGTDVIG